MVTEFDKMVSALTVARELDPSMFSEVDGRIDLRGMTAPRPIATAPAMAVRGVQVRAVSQRGLTIIRDARIRRVNFSGSCLDQVQFVDCELENCVFDEISGKELRFFGGTMENSSFRRADLRGVTFGRGRASNQHSRLAEVDFSGADLRSTGIGSAKMENCDFSGARLERTEFHGTVLTGCKFAGPLREVVFYGDWDEGAERNQMSRVDLRKAKLFLTQFRDMDMLDIVWPEDEMVFDNYRSTLDGVIALLKQRSDARSKKLRALLEPQRKWAGPNQARGFVAKADLVDYGGPGTVEEFELLVEESVRSRLTPS